MSEEKEPKEKEEKSEESSKEEKPEEKQEEAKKEDPPKDEKPKEEKKEEKQEEKKEEPVQGEIHIKLKADVLKTLIGAVTPIVNEALFNVKTDGISCIETDPAHVAMVSLEFSSKACEEYHVKDMELGLDLDKFEGLLKLAKSDEIVSLDYDGSENRLRIGFGNLVRRMGLVDPAGMPQAKVPNLMLPAEIHLELNDVSRGIKAAEQVSDHLKFTSSKDSFIIFAEGDIDTVEIDLKKDQLISLNSSGKYSSLFSLDYLATCLKAAKGNSELSLKIGQDNPMSIEYGFAGGDGKLTYLLAPRIEESD